MINLRSKGTKSGTKVPSKNAHQQVVCINRSVARGLATTIVARLQVDPAQLRKANN